MLEESLTYVMEHMRSYFDEDKRITKERIETCSLEELVLVTEEYIVPYLEFVKENQKIFRTAISQPSALKVNGIFSVVSEWVKSGCREDTQYIFEVMAKCMKR